MKTIIDAALAMLRPHMTISLGGGSNVSKLAQEIATVHNLPLTICTPSELTKLKCEQLSLSVSPLSQITSVDFAFDGCDSADYQLNLLKSNGGIHTLEKIYAQTATEYIILTPFSRIKPQLDHRVPLTLEVLADAVSQVLRLTSHLGLKAQQRKDQTVASFARTPNGNRLIDCYAVSWQNIENLNFELRQFNGVVGTSYFSNTATAIITTLDNKEVKLIRKGDLK